MHFFSTKKWALLWLALISSFSLPLLAQTVTKFIVVDQFGYLPDAQKVAVIRDPQTGFDASDSFTPGATYAVIDKATGTQVATGSPVAWKNGDEDPSSGDKVWWFDFSAVTAPGSYYVLDIDKQVRSYEFNISADVYKEVLKHAVRTFFYQRAGHEKQAQYAGVEWADAASHLKNGQDKNARVYNDKNNAATEKDVQGGWYDAGDYNKYTNWTANYVVDFMRAYLEAPGVWGDDYNLPESGNHIPDILDEAKWGVDHLVRMQQANGSVLSIVGLGHASPPSSATEPSYYGTASTSATLNTAGALALAGNVYGARGMTAYATTLKEAAIKAWNWADANPNVIFRNNDGAAGTLGLGAGQQETDDYGRLIAKLEAACFLFELTGEAKYRTFFDNNYRKAHLMEWNYAYTFETSNQEALLHYTTLPNATASVVSDINATYKNAMLTNTENFPAYNADTDPYRAYLKDYTWGSNSFKASQALMYTDLIYYGIDPTKEAEARQAVAGYIHYLHGVNPFAMVYLSNMNQYGAENSVNEFYHTWFTNGSAKWDRVGTSTYGPAPGFVTGGPNPSYDWDGCCPGNCGGTNNAICSSESLTPPKGQPAQKSYKDFNTSWPLNSWSVTENSNGYQLNYIRLLSKFVSGGYDCSGTLNGTATYDVCNRCAGGNTGATPMTDATQCVEPVPNPVTALELQTEQSISVSPNPTDGHLHIRNDYPGRYQVRIVNSIGKEVLSGTGNGDATFYIGGYRPGVYLVVVSQQNRVKMSKIVKL
jgi:endoglucanase